MIAHPRPGQRVTLRYRAKFAHLFPYHGASGVVVKAARRSPINHLVRLDCGVSVIVPCGNLTAGNGLVDTRGSYRL